MKKDYLLNLPSLSYRRLRGDLIECYKLLNNMYDPVSATGIITKNERHSNKLSHRPSSNNKQRWYFSHRTPAYWNSLPQNIVTAPSLNTFERRLDRLFGSVKFERVVNLQDNPFWIKQKLSKEGY